MSETAASVLIVDDHPIVREGLTELINREQGLSVCGVAESARQALENFAQLSPDIFVIDLSLEDLNGLNLIKDLRARSVTTPILVLSMHDETLYAERALRAGAQGYIMKREAPTKVIDAIRLVLRGDVYLSPEMSSRLMQRLVGSRSRAEVPSIARLSDRELEVYTLVGQGLKTREVAVKLNLSVKTVETYREHIKEKLGLKNATELVQSAIKWVHTERTGP